MQRKWVRVIEG